MLLAEHSILIAKADLEFRDRIHRAWLAHIEGEGDASEYACFYHYMKHRLGISLGPQDELRLVGVTAGMRRGDVSTQEMKAAEAYGLFNGLAGGFSKWQAVLWGRLACASLFAAYGVNGQALLEDLDLHLIRGQERLRQAPEQMPAVHALAIEGHDLAGIAARTGHSRAVICACLWFMAA